MAVIRYTARRSMVPGHAVGDEFAFTLRAAEITRGRRAQRSVQTALGGTRETTYYRGESTWDLRSALLDSRTLPMRSQVREFIDSVESGESFTLDPYSAGENFFADPDFELSAVGAADSAYWNLPSNGVIRSASGLGDSKCLQLGANSTLQLAAAIPRIASVQGHEITLETWYYIGATFSGAAPQLVLREFDAGHVFQDTTLFAIDTSVAQVWRHVAHTFTVVDADTAEIEIGVRLQDTATAGFVFFDNLVGYRTLQPDDPVTVQLDSEGYEEPHEQQTNWVRFGFRAIEV